MNLAKNILLFLSVLVITSSCSLMKKMGIEKRHYRKGYHFTNASSVVTKTLIDQQKNKKTRTGAVLSPAFSSNNEPVVSANKISEPDQSHPKKQRQKISIYHHYKEKTDSLVSHAITRFVKSTVKENKNNVAHEKVQSRSGPPGLKIIVFILAIFGILILVSFFILLLTLFSYGAPLSSFGIEIIVVIGVCLLAAIALIFIGATK